MVSDTFIKAKSWEGRESTHAAPVSFFREDEDHFSPTRITSASSYSCADGELSCLLYPLRGGAPGEGQGGGQDEDASEQCTPAHHKNTHTHTKAHTWLCTLTHTHTDIRTHFYPHVNTHRQTHMQVTLSLQICQFIVGLGLILLHLCKKI